MATNDGILHPTQRDADARLQQLLDSFGLGTLKSKVMAYLQEGMGEDSIMLQLQTTNEWKQRFAANEVRRKNGLPVLTPAEYISTERTYRQILQEAGVPTGFYDSQTDFQKFLENDLSPSELQGRVKAAADFVDQASPDQKALFSNWYSHGDMIAYALDPKKAAPLVGKQIQAASIGGIGAQQGLQVGQQTAEQLAAAGVTDQQARQGLGQAALDKQTLDTLAGIDQQQALTGDQLAKDALLGDAGVRQQKDKLASRERARLSGRSGVGTDSLGQGNTGL